MSNLKLAKGEAVNALLRPNSNVVGVGIGKKVKNGQETQEDCVRVYVVSKIDIDALIPKYRVPPNFLDASTDVIEVGRFGRRGYPMKPGPTTAPPPDAANAAPQPGSLIRVKTGAPNVNEGARGTLGAVVTDGTNRYILSCNHVLSRNGRIPKNARVVSAQFVGTQDIIAVPKYSVKLDPYGGNSVDCAMASITATVQTEFPARFIVCPGGLTPSIPTMNVAKLGALTGSTNGTVVDVDVDLFIDYSFGTFRFENQVMIDGKDSSNLFATAGDSGSIVVDQSSRMPTAMIFAASGGFAVACPLDKVLQGLKSEAGVEKLDLMV